jgi:hypothetical protein
VALGAGSVRLRFLRNAERKQLAALDLEAGNSMENDYACHIPFGSRAIELGVRVDGIWTSPTATPEGTPSPSQGSTFLNASNAGLPLPPPLPFPSAVLQRPSSLQSANAIRAFGNHGAHGTRVLGPFPRSATILRHVAILNALRGEDIDAITPGL